MDKVEFIKECAMRNLSAAISASGTLQCIENDVVSRCVELANRLADKLYIEE